MNRSQKIGIFALLILSIIGIIYSYHNFQQAFPEVELPIEYDKETASMMIDSLLERFDGVPAEFKSVIIMDVNSAKTYIDKEFGGDTIPDIHLVEKVPVWNWSQRYFVPLQKEEYLLEIRPDDGVMTKFVHTIPETLAGADIPVDSARFIADSILVSLGYDLDEFEHQEEKSEKRPNRTDHWFTYEKKDWSLGEAKFWIMVGIQGDTFGSFSVFLHVPEGWWREFSKTRSSNSMFQQIDTLLAAIFGLAMLVYLLLAFRRKGLAWKFGAVFGFITFAATFLMQLNMLPLSIRWYNTADSFGGFIAQQILYAILGGAATGLMSLIAGVAGERIYREFLPKFDFLPQLFSPSGWRTRNFRSAVIVGYIFAIVHIGFVIFFYVAGKKFGFWSPTDTNYTNLMSTYLPWLFPLAIGLMASISEDFMFRLFGVPFLSKLFKSTVIGVIIPAFIWGFLHSTYPQEPGYVRGIEVGLIGVAAGWLLLRYGIVACLTWHFVIDAGLIGYFTARQGTPLDIVLTVLVVLLPVILIGLGFIFGKRKEIATNEEIIPPEITPIEKTEILEIPVSYKPLVTGKKVAWGVIALIGLVIALLAPQYPHQTIAGTRTQAITDAKDFLVENGVETDSFKTVAQLRRAPNDSELRYTYQQDGWNGIEELWGENKWESFYTWNVRFFISEKKNEYQVLLNPDGEIVWVEHHLEESDSGETISQDSAYVLAKAFLDDFGYQEILDWELIEKSSRERPNRTDHYFTWQSLDSIGQAHKRMGAVILGDEAFFSKKFLKCPEEWERKDSKTTALSVVLQVLPIILIAIAVFLVIITFGKSVAKGRTSLKAILWTFIIVAITTIIMTLNDYPKFFVRYYTAIPLSTFMIIQWVGNILSILFSGIIAAVCVGAFFGSEFRRKLLEKIPFKETLYVSVIGTLVLAGLYGLFRWLEISLNLPLRSPTILMPLDFDSFIPILSIFTEWKGKLLTTIPALFVVYAALKTRLSNNTRTFIALVAVMAIIGMSGSNAFGEIAWAIAKSISLAIVGWFFVREILKDNVPLYVSTVILAVGLQFSFAILATGGNTFFLINGVVAILMTIILWVIVSWFFNPKKREEVISNQ